MKTFMTVILACAILALSSCASSKPCPAYAKVVKTDVKG
jgi:hypothetical protein